MSMEIAAEAEIAQFVSALFRYADPGSVVALRSFTHDRIDRTPRIQGWPVISSDMHEVIKAACQAATQAANDKTPLVFCPPVATFRPGATSARQEDLANGVAISVELDEGDTLALKRRLEGLLGPATVAVASGGQWTDPDTGEMHDKLHLHWRLSEPTATIEDHAKLKHARNLVMLLAGADPSAVPLVHPLRWPGSWHRKGKPRLALIQASNPDAEVHLDDAIGQLEDAVELAGLKGERGIKPNAKPGQPQAPIKRLKPAIYAIPNADVSWDDWNKMGGLLHRASGGSSEGLGLWIDWSMKSPKYVAGECDARWSHFGTHGFTRAGAGTLFHMAKAHGWGRAFVAPVVNRDEPLQATETKEIAASATTVEPVLALGRRAVEMDPIEIVAGEIDMTATAGEDALVKSRLPVFRRDTMLVRPFSQTVPAAKGRLTIVAGLDVIGQAGLIDMLSQAVPWMKHDARSKGLVPCNPPTNVADIILSRAAVSRLPPIAGVITTPTLRPDGTVLRGAGYDVATRLYHIPDPSLEMPDIPAKPTRLEADRALDVLSGLIREFPFASEVDRAVALSAIITASVRGALTVAPMHAFRASTAGSGKSYLADVVSMISTGRRCPVMAIADNPAETEKRLQAMLLSGSPIISLDNVNGELGGDLLCQAIERPLVKIRILGQTKDPEIESRATFLATGNSLRVRGDMTRRTLLCNLDANMERPELREFMDDPVDQVSRKRGDFVAACLTMVLAYREAGEPVEMKALASFDEWNDWVRGTLIWLGCEDPVQSMEQARDDDPELTDLREVLTLWDMALGLDAAFTIRQIDDRSGVADHRSGIAPLAKEQRIDVGTSAKKAVSDGKPGGKPSQNGQRSDNAPMTNCDHSDVDPMPISMPDFRAALLRIAGDRSGLSGRLFGKWLLKNRDRIVDGLKITRKGKGQGGLVKWAVVKA